MVAGRFALCGPLGRGAAGTVWRAWDLRRGDWCAKISNPAVFGRLVRLEELGAGVTGEQVRDAALDEVREYRPTPHTGQLTRTASPDRTYGVRVLAGLTDPDVLARPRAGSRMRTWPPCSEQRRACAESSRTEPFRSGSIVSA